MGHEVIKRVSRGMLKGVAACVVVFGAAAAVRAMLPALRPWKPYGLTSTVVPRANPGENTTTFLLVSKHSGCTVIIR